MTASPNETTKPKPFLKWAGGKTQLLKEIECHLPEEIKEFKEIDKYFEPFVGGGAVFFYLLSQDYEIEEGYLSDINKELILTYNVIRDHPKKLIKRLKYISEYYKSKNEEERKKYYYFVRKSFNKHLIGFNYDKYSFQHVKRASQMIFLNKTCFNGLFRVNSNDEFNVPMGRNKNPLICDEENILAVSDALQNVRIENASYLDSEELIDENSFVYLDPPYRPLKRDTNFLGYSKDSFDDNSQIELGKFFKRISCNNGAKALLSNSDPHNTDKSDNFFDDLYEDFNIDRVYAKRYINSKGDKRGDISEILVDNYEFVSKHFNI